MFDIKRKTIDWAGRPLTLETGRIARQADGAVLATYGETVVLATVVYGRAPKPGLDFFPLTVNYQEKTFAAGKIPGGYFKREGRPSEKETLVSRLIDRPIRPLFVKGFKNETQVVVTVLQHDMENDPDVLGMVAASAALTISGVPFMGPIGAARVGLIDGELVLNPAIDQIPSSDLDLVVAGTQDALMMVESEAKELSEEKMLEALMFAHAGMQPVIDAIIELAEHAAKEPFDFQAEDHSDVVASIKSLVGEDIKTAYTHAGKYERRSGVDAAKKAAAAKLVKTDENPDGVDGSKFSAGRPLRASKSSMRLSARKRLWQLRHSTSGSVKVATCPDASHTRLGRMMLESSPTMSPRPRTKVCHHWRRMFSLSSVPRGP